MTNIHFCDLCNESVPETDLATGRALLVKGRVVCATCNRAMSANDPNEPSAAAPVRPAPFQASHGPSISIAPPRSGAVVFAGAVGVLAITLTAALGYWTGRQLEERGARAADDLAALQSQHDRLATEFTAERSALLAQIAELERKLAGADTEQARVFDERLAEQARAAEALRATVAGLDPKFAALDHAVTRLESQDKQIAIVEQRFADLARDLNALEGEVNKVAAMGAAAPTPAVASNEAAAPAWQGLLGDLTNESVSVRWQAITALGETRDPAIAPHVLPALKDPDIFIRVAAARVLGDVGNPIAVDGLIEALDDEVGTVRDAAYLALKAITKRDFPFDAETEDKGERGRRIKAWRDWWEKERSKFGA